MSNRKSAALLILATVIVLGCRGARAQSRRASPHERTPAVTIGGSEIFIEYGRPYTRGRKIFGNLVRWEEVWCPGADEATYLSTTKPLQISGTLKLEAGKYSLWIQPTEDVWSLIFNSDWDTFHTAHRSRADIAKVPMQKQTLPQNVEQLTFTIAPAAGGSKGGQIAMEWATTRVSVPFTVE
jgi:hypothetical protein